MPSQEKPSPIEALYARLETRPEGLSDSEAAARLATYGPNRPPQEKATPLWRLFIRQFFNPLIYVLLAAGALSISLQEYNDAIFIGIVLLVNAIIGTGQEFAAGRAAESLQGLLKTQAQVKRAGRKCTVPAEDLVPGDVLLLEAGQCIGADICLTRSQGLRVDESLLSGESLPVKKQALHKEETETHHAFSGTMVTRGTGRGVVVATGKDAKIGQIARRLSSEKLQAPLMQRMARFTLWLALVMVGLIALMGWINLKQGMALEQVLMVSVGMAVAAIPEGLPIALTVALAVGMRRMAKRQVIVRRLVAVEALGSCTMIATDKTGTLTENRMTVTQLLLPDGGLWRRGMHEESMEPQLEHAGQAFDTRRDKLAFRALLAGGLANETHLDGDAITGDPVDRALLEVGMLGGLQWPELKTRYQTLASIPYAQSGHYSAVLCEAKGRHKLHVKGSVESVLKMCGRMQTAKGATRLDATHIHEQMQTMAKQGLRVLALAMQEVDTPPEGALEEAHLQGMTFLGLVGMEDPLRPEAKDAVAACHKAGVEVVMITGDHPETAYAMGKQLGLCSRPTQVVTGSLLASMAETNPLAMDEVTAEAKVYARIAPEQKLDIVQSLSRQGHFVAMTGDGVNDAPALSSAHVGVAMGESGTDVARESADIILTDDRFSSIVEGIREGRIGYQNIRKVVFFLLTVGMAEIVLFLWAQAFQLPIPLFAVQLLWLNLVTSGIQDKALALEPAEGDELQRPPRPPKERIMNGRMLWLVGLGAMVMGTGAFATFQWLLAQGHGEDVARNLTLLLMVLFSNLLILSSRSQTHSLFHQSLLNNPYLLLSTVAAQAVHIAALYIPALQDMLHLAPVTLEQWGGLLCIALSLLLVMEIEKWGYRRWKVTHA